MERGGLHRATGCCIFGYDAGAQPFALVTSPRLIPDDGRIGKPLATAWRVIPAHDYGEYWKLDAVCSCGMRWSALAGRRAASGRRVGGILAECEGHSRRHHCVRIHWTCDQWYNRKLVAQHVVTYLLSALDQIA